MVFVVFRIEQNFLSKLNKFEKFWNQEKSDFLKKSDFSNILNFQKKSKEKRIFDFIFNRKTTNTISSRNSICKLTHFCCLFKILFPDKSKEYKNGINF
jgi:hypothetical protein